MRIKTLKKIDDWCGSFFLIVFWPLAYIFDRYLKRFLSPRNKICVLKILGGGSLLIAYPSLAAIKYKYPDKKLVLVCSREVYHFAQLCELFDEIYQVDSRSVYTITASSLNALLGIFNCSVIINLEIHSKMCVLFSFLTFSSQRYCLFQTWNKWQKNYINKLIFFNSHSPIYIGYEQIAISLGAQPLNYSEAVKNFQHAFPRSVKIFSKENKRIMGVAPFCSDLCKERSFSVDELVLILQKEIGQVFGKFNDIQIYGGPGDVNDGFIVEAAIRNAFPKSRITNLVGQIALNDLPFYLQNLDLLLSIDSGINHLARLLKVPTSSYWGPTDPALYLKEIDISIEKINYHKIPCSPCVHITESPPCNGDNVCLKKFLYPNLETKRIWEIKS